MLGGVAALSGAAQRTAEALAEALGAFVSGDPALSRQVVQMRAMEAPVKRLRGRARWQVFIKLYARGPTPAILEKMDELAAREWRGAAVCLEVDPANMA